MNIEKLKGNKGEAFAADYFLNKGFIVLERNYHSRYGEIDIIVENNEYIVFVEVKTRKSFAASRGLESVDRNKRIKIIKTAFVYLLNNSSKKQPRFDVVEVGIDGKNKFENFSHLDNAFDVEEYNAIF